MEESRQTTDIALIKQDIGFIKDSVAAINTSIQKNYTPLADFNALRARVDAVHRILAYFMVVIGVALIGAVIKLILK